MYIVVFKQHGALNCEQQYYGPFTDYMDAEDALSDGRVPLLYGQGGREWPEDERPTCPGDGERQQNGHRFVTELTQPGAL